MGITIDHIVKIKRHSIVTILRSFGYQIDCFDNAIVTCYKDNYLTLYNNATAAVYDTTKAWATDNSVVSAYGKSKVVGRNDAFIMANDECIVEAGASHFDTVQIHLFSHDAKIKAKNNTKVIRHI